MKSNDHIKYLKANDSIMLIKTIANPNIAYYIIRHVKGGSILTIQNLSDSEFDHYEQAMNTKYSFIPNKDVK